MMKLNVTYLVSANSDAEKRSSENMAYLKRIAELADCQAIVDGCSADGLQIVFVGGGGTEGFFLEKAAQLKDPVFLLTSPQNNSLAASMEILSWLKQHGRKGEILHGSEEAIAHKLKAIAKAFSAHERMKGMRLGQIGESSSWLIASDVDKTIVKKKTGMEIVKVSMEELFAEIAKKSYPHNAYTDMLMQGEITKDEIEKSLYVYGALDRIKEKYHLHAMTVRCFDLLKPVKTTGCMGLAILNAQGIYGGCEGDMPSLIAMTILGEISKQPVFMCNPSRIEEKAMVLAHCTLPLNMPSAFHLTTHYESGIGVAIAGHIPEGEATIFKCSYDLSRYFVEAGRITENLHEEALCRSQIRLALDDMQYFTTEPIANHHLVCCGDHADAVQAYFHWFG